MKHMIFVIHFCYFKTYLFQDKYLSPTSLLQTVVPISGEDRGAPHARALKEPQEITPSATMINHFASQSLVQVGRQANPDIQDIITGIVKLLNGKKNY